MKNFFYFNSIHRVAILVLTVVIVSWSFVDNFYFDNHTPQEYDFSQFQEQISHLKKKPKPSKKKYTYKKSTYPKTISHWKTTPLKVEINSADTAEFEKLPHIGNFFAKRICKYRNLLGGFYSIHQLKEVYGMDSVRFSQFEQYVHVDTILMSIRNINSLDEKELRKHPYISPKLARTINNYRQQHGPFKTMDDLYKIHLIDSHKFRKIVPYFTTHDSH